MANTDIFRRVLMQGGLPSHVVEAAIANFIWESGGRTDIDTTNQTGDNGNSWGAAQWQGSRRTALMDFARQRGTDWTDPETQALFVLEELNGPERSAYQRLLATSTPEEALGVWTNNYERAGIPHMEGRLALLNGGAPVSTPSSPGMVTTAGTTAEASQRPERLMDRIRERMQERRAGGMPILEAIRQRIRERNPGRETPFLDGIIANNKRRTQAGIPFRNALEWARDQRQAAGYDTPFLDAMLPQQVDPAPAAPKGPYVPPPTYSPPGPVETAPLPPPNYPAYMAGQAVPPRPPMPSYVAGVAGQSLPGVISTVTPASRTNAPGHGPVETGVPSNFAKYFSPLPPASTPPPRIVPPAPAGPVAPVTALPNAPIHPTAVQGPQLPVLQQLGGQPAYAAFMTRNALQ